MIQPVPSAAIRAILVGSAASSLLLLPLAANGREAAKTESRSGSKTAAPKTAAKPGLKASPEPKLPARAVTPSKQAAVKTTAKPADKRSAGSLFAVVIGPGPAWKKGQPLQSGAPDGHFRYWQALHRQGRVENAGPVGKDTGFILLRARSQAEANAVIAGDPAVKAGRFRAVARPYKPTFAAAPAASGE